MVAIEQAPLVGAVADVDAMLGEQRCRDVGGRTLEFEQGEVCGARVRLDPWDRADLGEEAPDVADVASAGAVIGVLVVRVG